ncbi:MAG: hypothetical protein ACYSWP_07730 [Planctomycetota bacterium]|jgi:hypothetical protein
MKNGIIAGIAILFVFYAGLCEGEMQSSLEGKQLSVRVYNKPDARGRDYKTATATIRDGAIDFNYPDANESTTFVIAPRDQKDRWYRETFGDGYHKYQYTEGPPYYVPVPIDVLKGREVVFRVYEDSRNEPASYRKKKVLIEERKVPLDPGEFTESTFVAIFGEDQEDAVIQKVFGSTFHAWPHEKGMYFYVPQKIVAEKKDSYCWTFFDALGNVVSGTEVEIWVGTSKGKIFLGKDKLDEQGRLFVRSRKGSEKAWADDSISSGGCRFVVSGPSYGKFEIAVSRYLSSGEVFLPCVPPGSEADERCIRGQVLDSNGDALAGLLVKSSGVIPKGGKWIGSVEGQRQGMFTDKNGRFRMYLPVNLDTITIGGLVPRESEYHINITPPAGSNLFYFKNRFKSGQENVIKLRPTYFHTFVFEGENGPITDPKVLREIGLRVEIEPGKRDPYFNNRRIKDGGRYPLGTYRASSDRLRFQAIEVTSESPEELVFKLPAGKTYCGRVLEGVTGLPMTNAQVKIGLQSDNTGDDGTFEIKIPPGELVQQLVVSKKNFLTVRINDSLVKKEANNFYRVADVKLFPSATVKVHPVLKVKTKHDELEFRPQWHIYTSRSPLWSKGFIAGCGIHPEDGIFRDFKVESGKDNSFAVPAGLNLRLHLRVLWDIEWAPVTIADALMLKQGEVLDLGEVEIGPLFYVFVDVRNSSGKAIEGVPVIACGDWDPAISNSDENGIAMFDFVGRSKGDFIVEYRPEGRKGSVEMRESIPYNISGPEDANSVFSITVSDAMLGGLFE